MLANIFFLDGSGAVAGGTEVAKWHNLMRPCGLFVTRGKEPIAVIGVTRRTASLTKGVPNLGPRLSVLLAKEEMLAHLGTEPDWGRSGTISSIRTELRRILVVTSLSQKSPIPIGKAFLAPRR